MSKNKYQAQVWVLPEDDANRQIAQGFTLDPAVKPRSIHICPVALSCRGWMKVRDSFDHEYNEKLLRHPLCSMVLLVDFDGQGTTRGEEVLSCVDAELGARVFVRGSHDEPERLKAALRMSYEKIGRALAKECSDGTRTTWEHELLAHNRRELERMVAYVRPILFG